MKTGETDLSCSSADSLEEVGLPKKVEKITNSPERCQLYVFPGKPRQIVGLATFVIIANADDHKILL
jgi:hypothetical protein